MLRLREIRKEQRITQKELAEKIGVKQDIVSRYESGERRLSLETAIKIAHALGCTVEELMAGK